jgi:hypothetical protein
MASSFQQQSRVRKMVYTGLIVALITVSMLYRKMVIEPNALRLQLRAESLGEVEFAGSAVRMVLLGSRGVMTTIMWQMAIEKQKRHQWNELDNYVTAITKLQPNFITPWMFQGWNLAYNVAVECDQPRDKYFYISRGTQLLAEGERRHQGAAVATSAGTPLIFPGNPDMRFYVGKFMEMKLGTSDEKNVMRCLFDLSCIDPKDWDPLLFEPEKGSLDLDKFKTFCQDHPRLIRRLREKLYYSKPEDIVEFLRSCRGIPSRFAEGPARDKSSLAPPDQQFPILPPAGEDGRPDPSVERFDHANAPDFDVFLASGYWYQYAQEPLPELPDEPYMGVGEPSWSDPDYKRKYRRPKMAIDIFRGYPARALEYHADMRENNEGWFGENGWAITDWFNNLETQEGPLVVGQQTKYYATRAWENAYQAYKKYGERTGQLLSPEKQKALINLAEYFRTRYPVSPGHPPPRLTAHERAEDNGLIGKGQDAIAKLFWQLRTKVITNFDGHYDLCAVERLPEVVAAREALYEARKLIAQKAVASALPKYRSALAVWLVILLDHPRFSNLGDIQVDTYKHQWRYLDLLQDQEKQTLSKIAEGMARVSDWCGPTPHPRVMVTDLLLQVVDWEDVPEKTADRAKWTAAVVALLGGKHVPSPLLAASALIGQQKVRLYLPEDDDQHKLVRKHYVAGTSTMDLLKSVKPKVGLIPLRRLQGPLELVYVNNGPQAKQLLEVSHHLLHGLAVGARPIAPNPGAIGPTRIILTTMDPANRPKEWTNVCIMYLTDAGGTPSSDWKPLLRLESVQQARWLMRLDRAPKSGPTRPAPPPSP